ncbi:hypothetical protein [Methanopyrus sp.]
MTVYVDATDILDPKWLFMGDPDRIYVFRTGHAPMHLHFELKRLVGFRVSVNGNAITGTVTPEGCLSSTCITPWVAQVVDARPGDDVLVIGGPEDRIDRVFELFPDVDEVEPDEPEPIREPHSNTVVIPHRKCKAARKYDTELKEILKKVGFEIVEPSVKRYVCGFEAMQRTILRGNARIGVAASFDLVSGEYLGLIPVDVHGVVGTPRLNPELRVKTKDSPELLRNLLRMSPEYRREVYGQLLLKEPSWDRKFPNA